jgi:hypothetical protein
MADAPLDVTYPTLGEGNTVGHCLLIESAAAWKRKAVMEVKHACAFRDFFRHYRSTNGDDRW